VNVDPTFGGSITRPRVQLVVAFGHRIARAEGRVSARDRACEPRARRRCRAQHAVREEIFRAVVSCALPRASTRRHGRGARRATRSHGRASTRCERARAIIELLAEWCLGPLGRRVRDCVSSFVDRDARVGELGAIVA
jgi:hypothetical protein